MLRAAGAPERIAAARQPILTARRLPAIDARLARSVPARGALPDARPYGAASRRVLNAIRCRASMFNCMGWQRFGRMSSLTRRRP